MGPEAAARLELARQRLRVDPAKLLGIGETVLASFEAEAMGDEEAAARGIAAALTGRENRAAGLLSNAVNRLLFNRRHHHADKTREQVADEAAAAFADELKRGKL